jgi:hypothetical protein
MTNPAPEPTPASASEPALDDHHREFLDYLIERAWLDFLARIGRPTAANDNTDDSTQRAE